MGWVVADERGAKTSPREIGAPHSNPISKHLLPRVLGREWLKHSFCHRNFTVVRVVVVCRVHLRMGQREHTSGGPFEHSGATK